MAPELILNRYNKEYNLFKFDYIFGKIFAKIPWFLAKYWYGICHTGSCAPVSPTYAWLHSNSGVSIREITPKCEVFITHMPSVYQPNYSSSRHLIWCRILCLRQSDFFQGRLLPLSIQERCSCSWKRRNSTMKTPFFFEFYLPFSSSMCFRVIKK